MRLQGENLKETKEGPLSGFGWREAMSAVWDFIGEEKTSFAVLFVVLFFTYFYDLVPAFIIGKIIDFFTSYRIGDSLSLFYFYVIFLGVSWAFFSVFRLVFRNLMNKISIRARTRARVESFERLLNFSLAWHANENSGNKVQRISTGSDAVQNLIRMFYGDFLRLAIGIFGVVAIVVFLNLKLAAIFLFYAATFGYIEYSFSRKVARLSDDFNKANEQAAGILTEGTGNMLAIKALGVEGNVHRQMSSREEISKRFSLERANLTTSKWSCFQVFTGVLMSVFLYVLGDNVLKGITSVGSIAVLFTYFTKLYSSCGDATILNTSLIENRSDLGRMMMIFKDVPKIRSGPRLFPKDNYEIKISSGSFTYDSGQSGIRDLNISVSHNEILGIAGLSGSGKSTLGKILLGLYELSSGRFTIGGIDYYKLKRDEATNNISVILQETELFNFSLQDNITMMRDIPKALLDRALEISQLNGVIERLPNGLQTLIGERGYMLSGGERQRLGIARAICKDPKVMILDEATSSLDSRTEKKITDALLSTYRGKKTFIIIAHRLSTLRTADRVVVFERGTIIEEGKFKELSTAAGSRFAEMYKIQNERHKKL